MGPFNALAKTMMMVVMDFHVKKTALATEYHGRRLALAHIASPTLMSVRACEWTTHKLMLLTYGHG